MTSHLNPRLSVLGGVVCVLSGVIVALVVADDPAPAGDASAKSSRAPDASSHARTYAELRGTRRGPNGDMYADVAGDLAARVAKRASSAVPTEADHDGALAARRARRAYDGAPPTIPHAVAQETQDCAACHVRGAVIAGKTAPRLSHPVYASCTQCHVPDADPRGMAAELPQPPPIDNGFVGLEGRARGERAYPGAPPTIPHRTRMREDCTSCHGPTGKLGLRTPHLERASCTQCHAPSALLDQRPQE